MKTIKLIAKAKLNIKSLKEKNNKSELLIEESWLKYLENKRREEIKDRSLIIDKIPVM
jgi:hypothetical protein